MSQNDKDTKREVEKQEMKKDGAIQKGGKNAKKDPKAIKEEELVGSKRVFYLILTIE